MKKEIPPLLSDLIRIVDSKGSFDESKVWLIKGTQIPHHPTEPAVQYTNGNWTWYWMGNKECLSGPALHARGQYAYFIKNIRLSKREWESHPRRIEWLKNKLRSI